MIKNIFNALTGKNPYWETRRISADYGQSADFVSYRVAQTWRGDWQVYFCDYVPLSRFAKMKAKDAKLFEKAVHSIQTGQEEYRDFRAQVTSISKRCPTLDAALAFLQEKEAGWKNDRFLKAVSVAIHDFHFTKAATAVVPSSRKKISLPQRFT